MACSNRGNVIEVTSCTASSNIQHIDDAPLDGKESARVLPLPVNASRARSGCRIADHHNMPMQLSNRHVFPMVRTQT